jgi:hypothetical protein
MIYTFRSKAAGDLIMLGEHGDRVMTLLGREPAIKGIFEARELGALIARLESAVADEPPPVPQPGNKNDDDRGALVGMKARVWPLVEMMRRAQAANEAVVWGV